MTAFCMVSASPSRRDTPAARSINGSIVPPRPARVYSVRLVINERSSQASRIFNPERLLHCFRLVERCSQALWVFRRLEGLLEDRVGVSITRDADSPGLSSDQPHQRTGV